MHSIRATPLPLHGPTLILLSPQRTRKTQRYSFTEPIIFIFAISKGMSFALFADKHSVISVPSVAKNCSPCASDLHASHNQSNPAGYFEPHLLLLIFLFSSRRGKQRHTPVFKQRDQEHSSNKSTDMGAIRHTTHITGAGQ